MSQVPPYPPRRQIVLEKLRSRAKAENRKQRDSLQDFAHAINCRHWQKTKETNPYAEGLLSLSCSFSHPNRMQFHGRHPRLKPHILEPRKISIPSPFLLPFPSPLPLLLRTSIPLLHPHHPRFTQLGIPDVKRLEFLRCHDRRRLYLGGFVSAV
jgi:hypothetical protein